MKKIEETKLSDLLPSNLAKDTTVKASAEAIDPFFKLLAVGVEAPAIYAGLNALTGAQLGHLARGWDVTPWRDSWSVDMKLSVLKTVAKIFRKRGTVAAVKEAVASLGSAATIVEWWQMEPMGTPHTFRIDVNLSQVEGVLTAETQEDLIGLIDMAKPARSHYELTIQTGFDSTSTVVGHVGEVSYARISDI